MSPAVQHSNIVESIYNLIPKPKEIIVKPKRYASQFSKLIREEAKKWRHAHRSMGLAKVPPERPQNYLKKHSRLIPTKSCVDVSVHHLCSGCGKHPDVPRHWERPLTAPRSQRDFVLENALAVPCQHTRANSANILQQHRRVDSPRGHVQQLQQAGLVPRYVNKEEYGIVPSYLQRYLAEVKHRQELQQQQHEQMEETHEGSSLTRVSDQEKAEVLMGLKHKLAELQCQYLGLSVVTDTLSKRRRKLLLEANIDRLEKDINLLERNRIVYIRKV